MCEGPCDELEDWSQSPLYHNITTYLDVTSPSFLSGILLKAVACGTPCQALRTPGWTITENELDTPEVVVFNQQMPSSMPSISSSPSSSILPSPSPTTTQAPSHSMHPFNQPSNSIEPSASQHPSLFPTKSSMPSLTPSESPSVSTAPSGTPSASAMPTLTVRCCLGMSLIPEKRAHDSYRTLFLLFE